MTMDEERNENTNFSEAAKFRRRLKKLADQKTDVDGHWVRIQKHANEQQAFTPSRLDNALRDMIAALREKKDILESLPGKPEGSVLLEIRKEIRQLELHRNLLLLEFGKRKPRA